MAVQGVTQLTAVGVGSPILINLNQFHFGVGLIATLTLGNATAGQINFGCQVSGDNPLGALAPTSPFTHWNAHDVLTNLTASANDSLRYPCSAIRLIINSLGTTVNWTGSVALAVIQTNSL